MFLEENKAILRRMVETENKRNLALIDELMAPDYVDNALQLRSREEYKQMQIVVGKAFPDFNETIEDITAEGNKQHGNQHCAIGKAGKCQRHARPNHVECRDLGRIYCFLLIAISSQVLALT